jgi:hypothetical protein
MVFWSCARGDLITLAAVLLFSLLLEHPAKTNSNTIPTLRMSYSPLESEILSEHLRIAKQKVNDLLQP